LDLNGVRGAVRMRLIGHALRAEAGIVIASNLTV
jgi:hypothetical protein